MINSKRYKLLNLTALIALVLYPFAYYGYYAGDAEIHLIYAKNAALGHLFEFNLGEKSSGETSTGYMLFLSLIFRLVSAEWVPILVKFFEYIAWFALLFVFYRILQFKKFNSYVNLAALLAVGLLPGSVHNSVTGMENVFFALLSIYWFYIALKSDYFNVKATNNLTLSIKEGQLGILMGIGAWIRPEAIPFFGIVVGTRLLVGLAHKKIFLQLIIRTIITLSAFSIPILLLCLFNYFGCGEWVPSSVKSRIFIEGLESTHIGPFAIDLKVLKRLLTYFPITFFWFIGVYYCLKQRYKENADELFAIFLFITYIFMYMFMTGAAHLSRYMIFLIPFWVLIAARGLDSLIKKNLPKMLKISIYLLAISLIVIYTIESKIRLTTKELGSSTDILQTMVTPESIKSFSDNLYESLGNPSKLPIILACAEVQYRYFLDDRFIVRSLDGRVDSAMVKYFHKDFIDSPGYLKERNVDYMMGTWRYTDKQRDLGIKLAKLNMDESMLTNRIRVTRLPKNFGYEHLFKIEKIDY